MKHLRQPCEPPCYPPSFHSMSSLALHYVNLVSLLAASHKLLPSSPLATLQSTSCPSRDTLISMMSCSGGWPFH
ncbi:hypothetical protein TIFTF001_029663 [Ficus carica]|uniref:Uncharacterized protein n=1 Tax=Ficus carica TaxID=3494 RepID=A0AA88J1T3_FICCA|nr:hypothetical protein TIFTF001_029663 [Ficus carica]